MRVCARSPCFASHQKRRIGIFVVLTNVHGNARRMACRGNGTSFPLPCLDLLVQLRHGEQAAATNQGVALLRVGADLANVVSIFLKTAGGDVEDKASARFINQARVRRSVVIDLIEEMKARGHRAYEHVDMGIVKARAEKLPENDVPPEMIRLLPLDASHDKILPNKNATPVVGEESLVGLAEDMESRRMNAVVCERSCEDEGDAVAQSRSSVEQTASNLKALTEPDTDDDGTDDDIRDEALTRNDEGNVKMERIAVKTGHH